MYTIKEAAVRSGVTVPVLRAWERRYGVVTPARTAGGYRLYDETAIDRIRAMRRLVADGWTPSVAASALRSGSAGEALAALEPSPAAASDAGRAGVAADASGAAERTSRAGDDLVAAFLDAAMGLNERRLEAALDEMFARGTFESVVGDRLLPAVRAVGDRWASGSLSVAAEHAASSAVIRRLAGAFQAAARPSDAAPVLVGLPPGARHEIGALAFSVVGRRAGLPVLYLGADLPAEDWVRAARTTRASAAVVGVVTGSDVAPAERVASDLHAASPGLLVALGGDHAPEPASDDATWRLRLPAHDLRAGVEALAAALARKAAAEQPDVRTRSGG